MVEKQLGAPKRERLSMSEEKARPDRRKALRYLIRFPVEVLREGEFEPRSYESDNISSGGLYIRSEEVFEVEDPVYIKIELPMGIGTVCYQARVVHVVPPSDVVGTLAGFGLVWDPPAQEGLDRWFEFVGEVKELFIDQILNSFPPPAGKKRAEPEGPAPEGDSEQDAIQRSHLRYAARLKVRFKSVEDLGSISTSDVSVGGMFLETDADFVVGELVEIQAVHPDTGNSFLLKAAIRWRGQKSGHSGIGIELLEMPETELNLFESFINRHIAANPSFG
jgi:Tfp pilus assembly protein PilZ